MEMPGPCGGKPLQTLSWGSGVGVLLETSQGANGSLGGHNMPGPQAPLQQVPGGGAHGATLHSVCTVRQSGSRPGFCLGAASPALAKQRGFPFATIVAACSVRQVAAPQEHTHCKPAGAPLRSSACPEPTRAPLWAEVSRAFERPSHSASGQRPQASNTQHSSQELEGQRWGEGRGGPLPRTAQEKRLDPVQASEEEAVLSRCTPPPPRRGVERLPGYPLQIVSVGRVRGLELHAWAKEGGRKTLLSST